MAKKNEIAIVKDEETGQQIPITEDFKRKAFEIHGYVMGGIRKSVEGIFETGTNLKKMRDRKLYLSFSNSFNNYIEETVGISQSHAYNFIGIVEKLPSEFVQLLDKLPFTITKLSMLLPLPDKALKKVTREQLEFWAELPVKDFKDEMRKTKARYQKVRRDKIHIEEENLSLKVEREDLFEQLDKLKKEIKLLKTGDKNEKILKLQQSRDNLLEKIKELELEKNEMQSKELKVELALAAIENAENSVTSAFVDLRKIEVSPAILPKLYSFYIWCRKILDTQITVLTDRFEPERGPNDLEFYAKMVDEEIERRKKLGLRLDSKLIEEPEKETE